MLTLQAIQASLRLHFGRVLIAEADASIREAVALELQQEGFDVVLSQDGSTALGIVQEAQQSHSPNEGIDLLIVDLTLPQLNGLNLCRTIRRGGSNLPILMISTSTGESDIIASLEVGADDFLSKPFSMRELVARCKVLLRGLPQFKPKTTTPTLRYNNLTLYPASCRITLHDNDLTLSPKEFRLLELFMTHPRRVWDREQLIERVWGDDFLGDSKTVDVHIRWLREKIETDPGRPEYIVTVRGFGYRFG